MTRSAKLNAFFGEGEFDFRLAIDALVELEELRAPQIAALGFPLAECSVERILRRLGSGGSQVVEIKAVIRLALIGAGMDKERAWALVERHVKEGYVLQSAKIAALCLQAALVGVPDDDPMGESAGTGETKAPPGSPMGASAGLSSTARARRSASTRGKPAQ